MRQIIVLLLLFFGFLEVFGSEKTVPYCLLKCKDVHMLKVGFKEVALSFFKFRWTVNGQWILHFLFYLYCVQTEVKKPLTIKQLKFVCSFPLKNVQIISNIDLATIKCLENA